MDHEIGMLLGSGIRTNSCRLLLCWPNISLQAKFPSLFFCLHVSCFLNQTALYCEHKLCQSQCVGKCLCGDILQLVLILERKWTRSIVFILLTISNYLHHENTIMITNRFFTVLAQQYSCLDWAL